MFVKQHRQPCVSGLHGHCPEAIVACFLVRIRVGAGFAAFAFQRALRLCFIRAVPAGYYPARAASPQKMSKAHVASGVPCSSRIRCSAT